MIDYDYWKKLKVMRYFKLSFVLIFIVTLILVIVYRLSSQSNRLPPLKQDSVIQVYFNHNQAQGADYTEPYRQITRPGDNLEEIIIDTLKSAQSTIDIAVQELRLPKIAQTLAERQQTGVKVRVILENIYNRPWSEFAEPEISKMQSRERERYQEFFALVDSNKDGTLSPQEIAQGDALIILRNANIPVLDDRADGSKGSGLMHHKFVVVDGSKLIVTSANFTTSDIHGDFNKPETRGNANNLLKINNSQLASLFTEEFNLMWGDGPGGQFDSKFGDNKPYREAQTLTLGSNKVTLNFSPDSSTIPWEVTSNGLIGSTLNTSKNSVDLALFVFSEQTLADILQNRQQAGIQIKALIDPEFAFQSYSEGLDMLGVALSNKCKYEANNNPWQSPIKTVGIPNLPVGDKLHHKFGIVDQETVITGSHNWSEAANYKNDETLLVINNPTITAHFLREFERLYKEAKLGIPDPIQRKINQDKQECPQLSNQLSLESTPNLLVNLNTASQAELETLPGIGTKLAQRIIAERQQQSFTSLQDLKRVSGIGESKLRKLAGKVTW
jgi:competence ComEA-like helix-hairpin-helix protein